MIAQAEARALAASADYVGIDAADITSIDDSSVRFRALACRPMPFLSPLAACYGGAEASILLCKACHIYTREPQATCLSYLCLLTAGCMGAQAPEFVRKEKEVQAALSERYRSSKATGAVHDRRTTSALQPLSSEVVDVSSLPAIPLCSSPSMQKLSPVACLCALLCFTNLDRCICKRQLLSGKGASKSSTPIWRFACRCVCLEDWSSRSHATACHS